VRALSTPPSFLEHLPVARDAWAYAEEVHAGQTRKFDGQPFMSHPQEVAALLHAAGCRDHVVAAGLLHDTVERTDATISDLARRFGDDVATLVGSLTEDSAIASYRERKTALRRQAIAGGPDAAAVFAADKISKVRQYRAQTSSDSGSAEAPRARRLNHYVESLRLLEQAIPGHPLVRQLRSELASLEGSPAAG
jgi:(p)ppGpp synthase/HD superfamily hydrolase